jgi:hypothetical protein
MLSDFFMLCPRTKLQSLLFITNGEFTHRRNFLHIQKQVTANFTSDCLDIHNLAAAFWVDFSRLLCTG